MGSHSFMPNFSIVLLWYLCPFLNKLDNSLFVPFSFQSGLRPPQLEQMTLQSTLIQNLEQRYHFHTIYNSQISFTQNEQTTQ